MKIRAQRKVMVWERNSNPSMREEEIFRELAMRMVLEMHVNHLKKLFNLRKLEGTPDAIRGALNNNDYNLAEKLHQLDVKGEIIFEGEFDTRVLGE